MPLNPFYEGKGHGFFYGRQNDIFILAKKEEILLSRLSWDIRSAHPESWVNGRKSSAIRRKWLNEAKEKMKNGGLDPYADTEAALVPGGFSKQSWERVIDGLGHYATFVDGSIVPGPLIGVTWVADGLVGPDLTLRLLIGSDDLEEVARKEKNWHPGTEGRILNLIDPSMYALIPKQTRILNAPFIAGWKPRLVDLADRNFTEEGVTKLTHFMSTEQEGVLGSTFQWLPADVDVGLDGTARFTSYVNNLNPPEQGEMYAVLEEILSTTFVPLWQKLLTHIRGEQDRRLYWQRYENDDEFDELISTVSTTPVELKGRRIQIIVRMATTHLTPGANSKHPGGRWQGHVPEEKIVAVGLYCYSNHNITPASLGLGEKVTKLRNSRHQRPPRDSGDLVTIETTEGRSLVFSNQLSHRFLPFELENPELPGHQKMLTFFLVDPGDSIISTARVPCQQKSWYMAELKRIFIPKLPEEMVEHIASFLDTPMDLQRTRKLRNIMEERRRE